ncbi:MAG: diaminopimelate epimerase [Anaeroplasmataceae bacterium]
MNINFTKMHGIGNDYIYVNCLEGELPNPEDIAIKMSARHFSVGSDGLVMICKSDVADAKMRMFNADGSEGKMCGNAIRCIGKYLYDNRIVNKKKISVETLSGIKYLELSLNEKGLVDTVSVDMGIASFDPKVIPVVSDGPVIDKPCIIDNSVYSITAVSMGNPHCVIYVDNPYAMDLEKKGSYFENNELFPERVNTEFVKYIKENHLQMRVWERGSGETWACGTGACAVAAASVKLGICSFNTPITIDLRGGSLEIIVKKDYKIIMKGQARKSYEGVYTYEY